MFGIYRKHIAFNGTGHAFDNPNNPHNESIDTTHWFCDKTTASAGRKMRESYTKTITHLKPRKKRNKNNNNQNNNDSNNEKQ